MNIFKIISKLYTSSSPKWILKLNDKDISSPLVQRFLAMDAASSKQTSILNKFAYSLPPRMYLSAAWAILFFNRKKLNKAPRIKYTKKETSAPKYDFILAKVKQEFEMSDKDLKIMEPFLIKAIEDDIYNWFSYYGIPTAIWLRHNLDADILKDYGGKRVEIKSTKGLDAWM